MDTTNLLSTHEVNIIARDAAAAIPSFHLQGIPNTVYARYVGCGDVRFSVEGRDGARFSCIVGINYLGKVMDSNLDAGPKNPWFFGECLKRVRAAVAAA